MLSIIVPVYKVEKYLSKCVDSILAQTYTDFELILVDDGSPDCCPDICDAYAKNDSRVRVIHQKNAGTQSAVIAGVEASRGEYIGFADSDDWLEPEMYEVLMGLMQEYRLDCAFCNFREISEQTGKSFAADFGIAEGLYDEHNIRDFYAHLLPTLTDLKYVKLVRWNKVFCRDKISRYILEADKTIVHGEDKVVIFPAMAECERVYYTDKILYNYRKNENSITGGKYRADYFEDQWNAYAQFDIYRKRVGDIAIDSAAFYWCLTMVWHVLNGHESFLVKRKSLLTIVRDARTKKLLRKIKGYPMSDKSRRWYYILRFRAVSFVIIGMSFKKAIKKNLALLCAS